MQLSMIKCQLKNTLFFRRTARQKYHAHFRSKSKNEITAMPISVKKNMNNKHRPVQRNCKQLSEISWPFLQKKV